MKYRAHTHFLAPFRARDFRLQWPADLLTSWAFEMEMLILAWYVLVTTGSVFYLTVLSALHYLGTLLAPGLGVVGDRIGLRNLLCLMRAVYAALAGTLAVLFLTDTATLPAIFAVAGLMGAVRPSDIGIRSALVAQSVPAHRLAGALAIARTTFDSARIFGALTGTAMFAAFGIANAYLAITSCYLASLFFTAGISRSPRGTTSHGRSPLRDLIEGLAYAWQTPHVQVAMLMALLVNFTAFPISISLMPYVAKEIYGLDERGLGLLVASFAVGALVGSICLAVLRDRVAAGRLMMAASVVWHAFLIAFVQTTDSVTGMMLLVAAGFAQSLSMLSLALMLLRTSEAGMRGRVMGVRMLAIYSLPVGMLLAGVLIPAYGYVATATGYATAGLVLTLVMTLGWYRHVWALKGRANVKAA